MKKDVKKVGLNKNDQDEAFKELDEQMEAAREYYSQYKEKVDELEEKLLFHQDNPDEKIAKLKRMNKMLREEKIYCLKA